MQIFNFFQILKTVFVRLLSLEPTLLKFNWKKKDTFHSSLPMYFLFQYNKLPEI